MYMRIIHVHEDHTFSPSVIGQFIYGNVKERRRWDQAIPLRCHGPFER